MGADTAGRWRSGVVESAPRGRVRRVFGKSRVRGWLVGSGSTTARVRWCTRVVGLVDPNRAVVGHTRRALVAELVAAGGRNRRRH